MTYTQIRTYVSNEHTMMLCVITVMTSDCNRTGIILKEDIVSAPTVPSFKERLWNDQHWLLGAIQALGTSGCSPADGLLVVCWSSSASSIWLQTGSFDWDCCTAVLSDILQAVDRGDLAALVLLDLSAAFDTVDHSILLQRLQLTFGISDVAHQWFESYLCSRKQYVRRGLASSVVTLRCVASHKGLFLARSCLSSILSTSSRWSRLLYCGCCPTYFRLLTEEIRLLLSSCTCLQPLTRLTILYWPFYFKS